MLNNLSKLLITQPLSNQADFFHALESIRGCDTCHGPRNLDDLADFLREHAVNTIVVSRWQMEQRDTECVQRVLDDVGVKLLR